MTPLELMNAEIALLPTVGIVREIEAVQVVACLWPARQQALCEQAEAAAAAAHPAGFRPALAASQVQQAQVTPRAGGGDAAAPIKVEDDTPQARCGWGTWCLS
jgi:hypothetical protein